MNKVIINGKSYEIPNGGVSIINNKIYVDGKEFTEGMKKDCKIVNVDIYGNVEQINCESSVTVNGNVCNINCGGSCEVKRDVFGDIRSGGSVSCKNVKGSVNAGGSVRCKSFGKF